MLSIHSPEKQNRSPSPSRQKTKKFNHKISISENELFDFHGNDLVGTPGYVKVDSVNQSCLQSEFKLISCVQSKEISKVKALLADRQFQVKKLQQDFAQFKLLSRMERQRIIKKLRDQLQTQKRKHTQQIKKWQSKFSQTMEKQELQLSNYKKQLQIYYKTREETELNTLREKYEKQLKVKEVQWNVMQKELEMACYHLKQQYCLDVQELKLAHERQKQDLKDFYEREVKRTQEQLQTKVLAVVCQKEVEVKLVQETKKQTIKKQEKYLALIGSMQRQKKVLAQKNDQLQMRCKVLNSRYESKQQQMKNIMKQHQISVNRMKDQLQRVRKDTQKKIQLQKLKILKDQYEKTQKIYEKLLKIQELKESIVQYHKRNQRQLQNKFQRRESRREDIEIIKEIEGQLAYKEREANQLYQNLKIIQLEKQNDDKIYTRIFTASRKPRKSSANRNDRDIYSLLKQSQTTDFRHLLKLSKKDEGQTKK